ncbi:MAG: type secretion system protein [Marmoricola sp.]|nr:type secretion system protein [Marmoricola sp.]
MTAAIAASLASFLMLRPPSGTRARPSARVVGALFICLAVAALLRWRVPIVVICLAPAIAGAVWQHLRRNRARARSAHRATAVLLLCEGLAADLAAGLAPQTALTAAAERWPEFAPVCHASHLGADVPGALRELADLPGAAALNHVSAAWTVAHRSGAGLAESMSLAARGIREHRALERRVDTELAAATATARLLAILPFPVLLIGRGAGGDPFAFLVATAAGQVCLAAGLLLSWLGTVWLDRIADRVRRS